MASKTFCNQNVFKMIQQSTIIRNLNTAKTKNQVFTESNAVMPCPAKAKLFNFIGAGAAITIGVTTGALISKNIASFLEENELFIPSDDDDDD